MTTDESLPIEPGSYPAAVLARLGQAAATTAWLALDGQADAVRVALTDALLAGGAELAVTYVSSGHVRVAVHYRDGRPALGLLEAQIWEADDAPPEP